LTDDHGHESVSGCCGACQNASLDRPRFVIGVFAGLDEANGAADTLRSRSVGNVNVVSRTSPGAQDMCGVPLKRCGRLYQQLNQRLETGAAIVVVDAVSPEQQLRVSRVLLESKCDVLLTHDGSRHAD
jgi:hypothetical protein